MSYLFLKNNSCLQRDNFCQPLNPVNNTHRDHLKLLSLLSICARSLFNLPLREQCDQSFCALFFRTRILFFRKGSAFRSKLSTSLYPWPSRVADRLQQPGKANIPWKHVDKVDHICVWFWVLSWFSKMTSSFVKLKVFCRKLPHSFLPLAQYFSSAAQ